MSLRSSLALLFSLTACDGVFGLTHVNGAPDAPVDMQMPPDDVRPIGPFLPVQTVAGTSTANGSGTPLTITFSHATQIGDTLVFACAISTGNTRLTLLKDDAGNLWTRALDPQNSLASPAVRIELWIATNAKPMTAATLQYATSADLRPLVAQMIEFPPLPDAAFEAGSMQASATPSTLPDTNPITTGLPSLYVGVLGTADAVAAMSTLTTPMFSDLQFPKVITGAGTTIAGDVAWAAQAPGTQRLQWTLSPANNWSAGIAAFRLP